MGTRALILKNNKKWIYTHWDGHPEELGKNLKRMKTRNLSNAQQKHYIHKSHTIDYDFQKKAWVVTDSRKKFSRLRGKKGVKHNDFFDYIYNLTRSGIFYASAGKRTSNFPLVLTKKDLAEFSWKKL